MLNPKLFPVDDNFVVRGNVCMGDLCDPQEVPGEGFQLKDYSPVSIWLHDIPGFYLDHDWRIITNGGSGGEFFSVKDNYTFTAPFKLMGSAPDNSLFVSASGNVGLGTATPAVSLDAKVSSSGSAVALRAQVAELKSKP